MRFQENLIQPRSILAIDDESDSRGLLKRLLLSAGILQEVLEFESGGDAASYLDGYIANPQLPLPEMLFLDLHMPKMDGFQFLWWLRSHERFDALPVIVLSSADTRASLVASRRLGADYFLLKYPGPASLKRAWHAALTRRGALSLRSTEIPLPREIRGSAL